MKVKKSRTIKVDYLARVEGEGGMYIKINNNKVEDIKLNIFEPPRFFEALLQGRNYSEAPDITSRICGICPIAYQLGAAQAMERAFGIKIDPKIRDIRRLIYCGEWIESHILHIYMLHAPDFLGYEDSISMAKDFPEVVKKGLKLKKIGNSLMSVVGGREIHAVNIKVGGLYKIPSKKSLKALVEDLKWARESALETIKWVSKFDFPDFEREYTFVSMTHPSEYPITEGNIISNKGLNIDISEFNNHFEEEHVKHSNALHCVMKDQGIYFVGPMARYNLNFEKLSKFTKDVAFDIGVGEKCNNPYKSIIIRSLEVLYAFDEALKIIEEYEEPEYPDIKFDTCEAIAYGCTEAPRGICYHEYSIDKNGIIKKAKIIPPTSQNQKTIEEDLYHYVSKYTSLSDSKLRHQCEQAIRNYDPCISCATHFLNLKVDRN
jgi:sulfhydrogenase subunit alpha